MRLTTWGVHNELEEEEEEEEQNIRLVRCTHSAKNAPSSIPVPVQCSSSAQMMCSEVSRLWLITVQELNKAPFKKWQFFVKY